jgi:hypothetical protein
MMIPRARRALWGVLPFLWACGSTTTGPTDTTTETGAVTVNAVTTGVDLDTEYIAAIGSSSATVAANGSSTIPSVPVGTASVQLSGVAANCSVTETNPQSVTVTANATSTVSFSVACTALPAADANTLIAQAIASMETALFTALNISSVGGLDSFSFAESNSLFNQALGLSPSNDTASFGAAVTGVFLLEDNADLRALVEDFDAWLEEDTIQPLASVLVQPAIASVRDPLSLPLSFASAPLQDVARMGELAVQLTGGPALAHDPPPSVTELQDVLRQVVRPAMIEALDHLAEINSSGFVFTITERMQGEDPTFADPLELDMTEIFAIQAGVEVALAAMGVATAYHLTPNPLSADGFVDAMTPGSTFLTLTSGGADDLSDALTRALSATAFALEGLDALEAEVDDQTDDIIKYDPTGFDGLDAQDISEARNAVQDIQGALTSPTAVTLREGAIDEFTFMLDAREFFVDPIADFKAGLPGYQASTAMEEGEEVPHFTWDALNLPDWTFVDPTFSGILPGMTNTGLYDLDLDELFFEFSLTGGYYELISVDGLDCVADYNAGGLGCPVGSEYYTGGALDIDGHDGQPEVYVNLWSDVSYISAFGSYTVTDNFDGTHMVDMNTVLQDGLDTPLPLTGTFTDIPGYTHVDVYFRTRGSSTIEVLYLGSTWIFEKSVWW